MIFLVNVKLVMLVLKVDDKMENLFAVVVLSTVTAMEWNRSTCNAIRNNIIKKTITLTVNHRMNFFHNKTHTNTLVQDHDPLQAVQF